MKIRKGYITNFGSYKHLEFDFSDTGLAIIYGATGSGKSTLQDAVPWVLFGITSKDGNVDEIRNWKATDEPTIGKLHIERGAEDIIITRIRGSSKDNDLYWERMYQEPELRRGKDLADTQRQINDMLSIDPSAYAAATIFNEFSETASFFYSKAKDRRQVLENVADLEFPAKVHTKVVQNRKSVRNKIEEVEKKVIALDGRLVSTKEALNNTLVYAKSWEKDKLENIARLETKCKGFEKEKSSNIEALETKSYYFDEDKNKKINVLVDKLDTLGQRFDASRSSKEDRLVKAMAILPKHCDKCGRINNTSDEIERLKADIEKSSAIERQFSEYSSKLMDIQALINPYKEQLIVAAKSKNIYKDHILEKTKEANPFKDQIAGYNSAIPKLELEVESIKAELAALYSKFSALEHLEAASLVLRGELLKKSVKYIEEGTNNSLSKYFDSEFRVFLELAGADSIEVKIQKNGYNCVYKQLSKGQRKILALCFSVAVMKAAANKSGVSFNLLAFDEALDGIDPELKTRAFRLFQDLSIDHSSVLVIDHDTHFRELFDKKYKVELISDESTIIHE